MATKSNILTKGGVLLLGSDFKLQQSVRAALQAENYEVLPATNPDEAQELLDAGLIEILVVDTDGTAERIGPWLARLTAQRQQMRVIGLREPRNGATKADLADVSVWLEKPLHPGELVAAVNGLLAARQSEIFREELLRRQDSPFLSLMGYRHWGLNE
jgi:DNA-binding response OmpR family regulator